MVSGNTMQESNLQEATILNPMSPEGIVKRNRDRDVVGLTSQIQDAIENKIPELLDSSVVSVGITPYSFITVEDGIIGSGETTFEEALGKAIKFYEDHGYTIEVSLLSSKPYRNKIQEYLKKGERPPTAGYKLFIKWNQ